jgi:acetyl-CoA synthetase
MIRGYRFPDDPDSWEELRAGFEWVIPEQYDIATATLDHEDGRTALRHVDGDGRAASLTYGDLDSASDAFAATLATEGVGAGDRVALCLPQCPELLIGYLAVFELGAEAVPLSMLLGDESVEYTLEHSGATTVVVDGTKFDDLDRPDWPSVERTVTVDPGAVPYDVSPTGGLPVDDGDGSGGCSTTVAPVETAPDDPALVLYTSGSTGRPKGVVQRHQYLIGSLPGYQCYFHLFDPAAARRARVWSPSEWAWAGALFNVVFPTLVLGGTVVSSVRRSGFDPGEALALVERTGVTHAFMPPTALGKIRSGAAPAAYDLSSLQVAQCGGEKLPPSLREWGERALGIVINEGYGQTEANALVGNCRALFEPKRGSMGRAYPGHEVSVVDADGTRLGPGELGELAVDPTDPVIFEGYLDDEAATEAKYLDTGLFRTDDVAVVDEDGYFWHRGRRDDLIITSGYRVSPFEIETALEADPHVVEAVVGGVPDEERGERVRAYVLLTDEGARSTATKRRLESLVRDRVGAHKVPDEIEFLESLPTTTSDKTDRSALFPDSGRTGTDDPA